MVWISYTIANSLAVVLIARGVNGAVGSTKLDPAAANRLVLFLAIGALVWHYLAVVFETVSDMISWERWEGTIEYTFMAPVSRFTHMVCTTLLCVVYGLVHTAIILAVIVVLFDLEMSRANYLSVTMVMLLASQLILIPLGVQVFRQAEHYAKRTGRLKCSG